jgi:hypothetical protein
MLIFVFCGTCIAASVIEDTFKEKMEYFNLEIRKALSQAEVRLKFDNLKEYYEFKDRANTFIDKRNDLKIKVYEPEPACMVDRA